MQTLKKASLTLEKRSIAETWLTLYYYDTQNLVDIMYADCRPNRKPHNLMPCKYFWLYGIKQNGHTMVKEEGKWDEKPALLEPLNPFMVSDRYIIQLSKHHYI